MTAPKLRWSFSLRTLFVLVLMSSLIAFAVTQAITIRRLQAERHELHGVILRHIQLQETEPAAPASKK